MFFTVRLPGLIVGCLMCMCGVRARISHSKMCFRFSQIQKSDAC
ncbi:hypothetical protein P879_06059 [Paragonimus westermani]|uniref:Uncharacterized protein n=1 Tax=Paragonimus westermani TaxID=34504 RepID=A0A8T0DRG7_9TREM|nr:hypothetical protein P879_06059 [Paragonimus westermani]